MELEINKELVISVSHLKVETARKMDDDHTDFVYDLAGHICFVPNV